MKKNILVTGAGGYIGTSLVDQLLEAGNRVVGVDQYFFGTELLGETKNNSNFKLLKKDIRDLSEQDLTGIDVVCDLAALSNDPCGDLNEELTYSINHRGRANVASLSKKQESINISLLVPALFMGRDQKMHFQKKAQQIQYLIMQKQMFLLKKMSAHLPIISLQ